MDVTAAQQDGGGTAKFAIFIVYVADVEFVELKSETIGRERVGYLAEKNDRLLTTPLMEGKGFRKFFQAADNDLDFPGHRHTDYRFAKTIGGYMIVDDDDA